MDTNTKSIGELALEIPHAIAVLERWQIDYCCHGQRSVAEACADAGVTTAELMREIAAARGASLGVVNKRIADLMGSAELRAARLFLTLADRVGIPRGTGTFIPLPLSRQEIADLIGTTLETAIRLMSRWQKDSLLETEKSGFLIPSVNTLKSMTE